MSESLADVFSIAARNLHPALAARSERDRLRRLAGRLAPIHSAGFECRLTGERAGVDLQQRIMPRNSEPARLAAHLLASGLCAQPGWRRIRDFMLAWSGGELSQQVIEFWLEYERDGGRLAPPSVFVLFNRSGKAGQFAPALRRALGLLAPPAVAARFARAAQEVGGRLPKEARICDIGLMARQPAVLRLNIHGVPGTKLEAALASLGWDRDERARIGAFGRAVAPHARHLKLALDWHGKLLPRVGLEIVPEEGARSTGATVANAPWPALLAWLVSRKLCDERRAAALGQWPGHDEPPDCPMPWPDSLIAESLLSGPGEFSVISRRLSHVKVDFVPGQRPSAKAYFGFLSLWGSSAVRPAPVVARQRRDAIARGAAFLLEQRSSRGSWYDFAELCDGSGEWLSAYVAAALAGAGTRGARHAARETWDLLAKRNTRPGWGYNEQIPVDADSTLWALRLAAAVGRSGVPRARAALALVRRHRKRNGGVATYLPEIVDAPHGRGMRRSIAGWCDTHAEVTAAAGALPGFARSSAAWLLRAQRRNGRWDAYWYDEDAYATALCAEHLAERQTPASRRARTRAASWALARVAADGAVAGTGYSGASAFAAACCLRILLAAPMTEATQNAISRLHAWLLSAQRADGGWRGSAPMRLPLARDVRPKTFGVRLGFARDDRGLFTTATVLDALCRLGAASSRGR